MAQNQKPGQEQQVYALQSGMHRRTFACSDVDAVDFAGRNAAQSGVLLAIDKISKGVSYANNDDERR
jgi:hypothetical protein